MEVLKIDFVDFWRGFNKENNYFFHLLSKRYKVELSARPDFVLYSSYGRNHRKYDCVRIFYASENVRPNLWECDFAFTFDHIDHPRHYRLPLYVLYDDITKLTLPKKVDELVSSKSRFCNFLYSNSGAKERIVFFEKLSRYKKIDSGGKVNNNLGYFVQDKLSFIKDYKFTIAFENSSYPGYTTEKIFHPMLVGSLPIYWGNPDVKRDFNTKSFVNVHDYRSMDDAIARIIEIDQCEELYRRYLEQSYFLDNRVPASLTEESILTRFDEIIFAPQSSLTLKRKIKLKTSLFLSDVKFYKTVVKRKVKRIF